MRPVSPAASASTTERLALLLEGDAAQLDEPPPAVDIQALTPSARYAEPETAVITMRLQRAKRRDDIYGETYTPTRVSGGFKIGDVHSLVIGADCDTAMATSVTPTDEPPAQTASYRDVWVARFERRSAELGRIGFTVAVLGGADESPY
ncbi:MAG: hypothetical protein KC636_18715 [Myxococcales bacterium]|nr:hypothetical protein [Myxococcales bacterium]